MTDHFRKKSIIFRDTRDHHEHDAKNRLLIPGPSSEKPVAEIHQLKKNRPQLLFGTLLYQLCDIIYVKHWDSNFWALLRNTHYVILM